MVSSPVVWKWSKGACGEVHKNLGQHCFGGVSFGEPYITSCKITQNIAEVGAPSFHSAATAKFSDSPTDDEYEDGG